MDNTSTDIFDLAAQRLAWVDRRQAMLAQNVANADTPGYQAKDVAPFAQLLARSSPVLARTDPQHLTGSDRTGADPALRPHERAPDGNAVSIEQELTKIADTQGTQSLTANLVQTYTKMFQTAVGK